MSFVFRTPEVFDCHELVANLREPDRREIVTARGGVDANEVWQSVQLCTDCLAVYDDEGLVCMYGVAPYPLQPEEVGVVWLLGTPRLDRHMFSLCRVAKDVLTDWHTRYPVLTNMTDSRNRRILRWLRWLGFRFVNEVPIGPERVPFIVFESRHV